MFWTAFFFKCVNDRREESYLLFTPAFDIVKQEFILNIRTEIHKTLSNLIDLERKTGTNYNKHIEYLVNMFHVCGIEKLMLQKNTQGQADQLDPLYYSEAVITSSGGDNTNKEKKKKKELKN